MSIKIIKPDDETNVISTGSTINSDSENRSMFVSTASGATMARYYLAMPQNMDVFSTIIKKSSTIENPEMVDYIKGLTESLRNVLHNFDNREKISNRLSKFILNNMPDKSVLIEWNFDNFRIGFSIEPNLDQSSYYVISDDKISGSYSSQSYLLKPDQFDTVANNIMNFVLRNT